MVKYRESTDRILWVVEYKNAWGWGPYIAEGVIPVFLTRKEAREYIRTKKYDIFEKWDWRVRKYVPQEMEGIFTTNP